MIFPLLFVVGCTLSTDAVVPTAPPTAEATETPPTPAATETPANPTRTPQTNFTLLTPQGVLLTPIIGESDGFVTPASGMRATISTPANGAIIGAVPITISGIVYDLSGDRITVEILDGQGAPIAPPLDVMISSPVGVRQASWSVGTNIIGYTGAAQVRVYAPSRELIGGVTFTIAPSAAPAQIAPPDAGGAPTGAITNPAEGSSVAGDPLVISGSIGGLPENQFTLSLIAANGATLNTQTITLSGAGTNVVPWSASLGTSGYRGAAELRASVMRNGQPVIITSVRFSLQ